MNSPTIHQPRVGHHARETALVPLLTGRLDISRKRLIALSESAEVPDDRFRRTPTFSPTSTPVPRCFRSLTSPTHAGRGS